MRRPVGGALLVSKPQHFLDETGPETGLTTTALAITPTPSVRFSANRERHRRNVSESTPQRRAISSLATPSAANSRPRACTTCRCGNDVEVAIRSKSARSVSLTGKATAVITGILQTTVLIHRRTTSDFYEIVVERHRAKTTIVTSNREPAEWLTMTADTPLAESPIDRLTATAHTLVIEGPSSTANAPDPANLTRTQRTALTSTSIMRHGRPIPLGNQVAPSPWESDTRLTGLGCGVFR